MNMGAKGDMETQYYQKNSKVVYAKCLASHADMPLKIHINIVCSKCLLRHDVVRVFVSFCVLVFVRAILSWCP